MLKSLQTKAVGLAGLVVATALLMGACPTDILNLGQQPAAGKPAAPTIQFVLPAARTDVQVGSTINIQWNDSHPAGAAVIELIFDHDGVAGTGDEQTITVLTESAATTAGTYAWNTTGITPGVYRLAASINDSVNPAVTTYLPYEVVIRAKAGTTPPAASLSLQMLTPATTLAPQTGEGIKISWKANDPSHQATLYLYYDGDLNPVNDNKTLIAAIGPGTLEIGSTDYGWTIPDGLNGLYNILGRLHNGVDPDVFAYAPGAVQVGQVTASNSQRDLLDVGNVFAGAIFDGYVPYGRLGEVMTGGRDSTGRAWDFDGDGYSDFILVAPKILSQVYAGVRQPDGKTGVGEAYLIYSRGSAGRWPQGQSLSVGNVGSGYSLSGVKFVGPAFTTSSAGIQDVMFLNDVDGDNRPEIVFSTSDINGVVEDQQDYDPLDNNQIHSSSPPALPGAIVGMYYYQCPGWQIYSDTPANGLQDGITIPPEAPQEMRSGLVAYVSSQSEGAIRDGTVLIDEIGGSAVLFSHVNKIVHADGMKIFPNAGGDDSGWGAKLGSSKIFGDPQYPAVLVARPAHASGAGSVKVMPHRQMVEITSVWTQPPQGIANFQTQPNCYTFPGADTTGGNDADRMPQWPFFWYLFMDPLATSLPNRVLPQPSELNFDIINRNLSDAANGHMTNPTGVADFDSDTVEDAAVAMPDALNKTGLAYLIYGNGGFVGTDVSQFATLSGTVRGFELRGTEVGEQLGYKMAGPGNVTHSTGDVVPGRAIPPDWVLTAPHRGWSGRTDCGAVIIIPGQALLGSYVEEDVVPTLGGAIIHGGNSGDQLGMYLCAAGDVDRDSYQDFLVSAPGYSDPIRGRSKCGAVYLIYGGPHLKGEFDIRDIGTSNLPGKMYIGPEANAAIGPVSAAGDTDNDYYDDFLIAQPNAKAQGLTEAGRVWLIYGGRRQAP